MRQGITFKGKPFIYEGSLTSSLKVSPLNKEGEPTGTIVPIDAVTIRHIKNIINEKGKIQMGACRDNPAPQSLGELLHEMHKSPQWLSYVLPLLEEEGFLTHYKDGRAFWVNKSINNGGYK